MFAYRMHKAPHVFPIVGGRRISHQRANVTARSVALLDDEMDKAYGCVEIPKGSKDDILTGIRRFFEMVPGAKPIRVYKSAL